MASTLAKYGQRIRPMLEEAVSKTHKYITSKGQLNREGLKKGIVFPNAVFTMIRPGKPMPPNDVVFRVPLNMNKIQIKDYIEEIYKVPVVRVNTSIFIGKLRVSRKGHYYKRPDWKKAIVTLTQPFTMPEFINVPKQRARRLTNRKPAPDYRAEAEAAAASSGSTNNQ